MPIWDMRTDLRRQQITMSVPAHRSGAPPLDWDVKPFDCYGFLFGMLLAKQQAVSLLHNKIGER